jgi:hypothetical protein
VPDGFMTVRHVGLLNASCAITTHTIRQMMARNIGATCPPAPPPSDPPPVLYCSDCGGQLLVVTRVFPFQTACFDTGEGNHTCENAHVIHPQSPRMRARAPCVLHTTWGFVKRLTVGATPGPKHSNRGRPLACVHRKPLNGPPG